MIIACTFDYSIYTSRNVDEITIISRSVLEATEKLYTMDTGIDVARVIYTELVNTEEWNK